MGLFFTNLQVKNPGGREEFLKIFKSSVTGWEICGESEAEKTLRLGFSECYVTVTCETYDDDPAAAENDAVLLSAALDTEVFSICGIDSDAAVMTVYSRGRYAGETAIGMADAYGMYPEPPEPALWEPLLKPGADISALSEIWQDDAVFVEDLLFESAELFGIEPEFMTAVYRYFDDGEPLYLRKSTDCPIKLAPKRFPKQTKHSDSLDSQTDENTVTIFGQKYDINSTYSIEQTFSGITDEQLIEAMPNIKRLPSLIKLSLCFNSISDISPLAELSKLRFLDLQENRISDISPLAKLTNLTELDLDENLISDITPLFGLVKLRALSLLHNSLTEADDKLLKERLPNCCILAYLSDEKISLSDYIPPFKT